MSVVPLLYTLMTVFLIFSGIILIVPAIRGVQVVVYRRATFALGLSTLFFVAGWVVSYVLYSGGSSGPTLGWYFYFPSGIIHIYAVWLFARDFINFEQDGGLSFDADTTYGGFDTNDGQ